MVVAVGKNYPGFTVINTAPVLQVTGEASLTTPRTPSVTDQLHAMKLPLTITNNRTSGEARLRRELRSVPLVVMRLEGDVVHLPPPLLLLLPRHPSLVPLFPASMICFLLPPLHRPLLELTSALLVACRHQRRWSVRRHLVAAVLN